MGCVIEDCSILLCLAVIICLSGASEVNEQCSCKIDATTETADCSKRNLTKVPECVPSSTRTLYMSENLLDELVQRQFERFKDLAYLDLSYNWLRSTGDNIFKGLSNLVFLSLDNTLSLLRSLNANSLTGLSGLKHLNLRFNNLDTLSEYVFNGLSELTYLDLNFNNLKYLNKDLFSGLSALKTLILDTNPLYYKTSFPPEIFKPLVTLEELHLNSICSPTKNCTYIDEQLSRLQSLKRLYIDGLPPPVSGPRIRITKEPRRIVHDELVSLWLEWVL